MQNVIKRLLFNDKKAMNIWYQIDNMSYLYKWNNTIRLKLKCQHIIYLIQNQSKNRLPASWSGSNPELKSKPHITK